MVVVEVLLLRIWEAHEQPILDLLAFRLRTPGGVQALENLLRVFVGVESDADHTQPLEAPEQEGNVIAGNQTACDLPNLGHGSGARRFGFEAKTIFLVVSVKEPQVAKFLRCLVRICQSIVEDDFRVPVAALAVGSEP